MKYRNIIGLFGMLALGNACASSAPESATGSSSIISGTDVHSPNANPAAGYLPSRSIQNLQLLGALGGPLSELASRVDGTLGTAASDGRISIEELLAIEKPGMIEQLVPAERIALPDLWKLFEAPLAAPTALTIPALDTILATEVSDPATTPISPANIATNTLSSQLQRAAAHLQQVHNSDSDPLTVTLDDLDAALAAPSDFQVGEISQFKTIKSIFLDRSGTALAAKVRVTLPVAAPYSPMKLLTWDVASIGLSKSIEYNETRTMDVAKGDLVTSLVGHVTQKEVITLPSGNQVLILDDGSDTETFQTGGVIETASGVKTVEVWLEGRRSGSFRVAFPKLEQLETNIDLSKYVDYKFVLDDMAGTVLDRNPVSGSGSVVGDGESAVFTCGFFESKGGFGYVADNILAGVATPSTNVAPGRYVLPTTDGDITVQVYPEGAVTVSRASNWTERAIFRGNKFVLPGTTDLQFSYDPSSNTATVKRLDNTVIFSAKLTGLLRTG